MHNVLQTLNSITFGFEAAYDLHDKSKQEGHDDPESLTRNNCFSVLECQYILILNLST
jgi:hypothetical protein